MVFCSIKANNGLQDILRDRHVSPQEKEEELLFLFIDPI